MKVTIIGAGNIGTAMAMIISCNNKHNVTVYSSRASCWSGTVTYENITTGQTAASGSVIFSSDLGVSTDDADVIFITVPSFMRKELINRLCSTLRHNCTIVFVPGCGGVEYCCGELIKKGNTVAGMDRVPCVSRIKEYGKNVAFAPKKSVRLAATEPDKTPEVCSLVSEILDMECGQLKNYLTVTLTPSNQIMHTVRLYDMFTDCNKDSLFDENIPFYGKWSVSTSELLIKCDNELHKLCGSLKGLDMSGVIPLTIHYESDSAEKLTDKIHSIRSFKNIESPMIMCDGGKYRIDFSSRYFVEDFPYGLCIIKSLGVICGTDMPDIDRIIRWYENIAGVDYFGSGWNGKDLAGLNLPENCGISSVNGIETFYS